MISKHLLIVFLCAAAAPTPVVSAAFLGGLGRTLLGGGRADEDRSSLLRGDSSLTDPTAPTDSDKDHDTGAAPSPTGDEEDTSTDRPTIAPSPGLAPPAPGSLASLPEDASVTIDAPPAKAPRPPHKSLFYVLWDVSGSTRDYWKASFDFLPSMTRWLKQEYAEKYPGVPMEFSFDTFADTRTKVFDWTDLRELNAEVIPSPYDERNADGSVTRKNSAKQALFDAVSALGAEEQKKYAKCMLTNVYCSL